MPISPYRTLQSAPPKNAVIKNCSFDEQSLILQLTLDFQCKKRFPYSIRFSLQLSAPLNSSTSGVAAKMSKLIQPT